MSESVEGRGLVPKLRFSQFEGDWKLPLLGSLLTLEYGSPLPEAQRVAGQIPVVGSNGVVGSHSTKLIDGPAIVVGRKGSVGKVNWIEVDCYPIDTTFYVRLADSSTDLRFTFTLLQRSGIEMLRSESAVPGLSRDSVHSLSLPMPSIAEQRKIAECLESLDELIAAETEKLEALKRYKKGLLQQLFPAEGETTPRLRFPQFRHAGDWTASALEQVCETSSGGTPLRSQTDYWNGDIPWITTSLINGNRIVKAQEFITELAVSETSAKHFPTETIVIAMYGQGKTRGKVAVLGIPATTNQACAAILPNEGISSQFLFFQLFNGYERLRSLSNSGGQDNLSQTLISQFEVALPPDKEEQLTIASVLDNAAVISTHQEIVVARLRAHKAALMQQLFPSLEEVDTPTE